MTSQGGAGVVRALRELAAHAAEAAREWWRRTVVVERWLVFGFGAGDLPSFDVRPDLRFRRLSHTDLLALRERGGHLAERVGLYYLRRGIDSAYGLYRGDRLVFVGWIYTAREYARAPFQTLKLEEGEGEVKHVVTLEEFRGQGIWPYAMRLFARQLFDRGFKRVFVTVDPMNIASIRGIEKAGCVPCGRVWRIYLSCLLCGPKWAYRKVSRERVRPA